MPCIELTSCKRKHYDKLQHVCMGQKAEYQITEIAQFPHCLLFFFNLKCTLEISTKDFFLFFPRSDTMNWSWKNLTLLFSHSPETLQKQSFPHAEKNRNKPEALKTSRRELRISLSQRQTLRSSLLGCTIQLLTITSTPFSGLGFCFFLHHANTRRVWQDRCMDFWKATWNSRVQLPPQHLGRGLNSKAVAVCAGVKTGSPASRNHGLLHSYISQSCSLSPSWRGPWSLLFLNLEERETQSLVVSKLLSLPIHCRSCASNPSTTVDNTKMWEFEKPF